MFRLLIVCIALVAIHGMFLSHTLGSDSMTMKFVVADVPEICKPFNGMTLKQCNNRIGKHSCDNLKWQGIGCRCTKKNIRQGTCLSSVGIVGDGGCQDITEGEYCGFQCRSRCEENTDCVWTPEIGCSQRTMSPTQSPTPSPTQSPTPSPTISPTPLPTTSPTPSPTPIPPYVVFYREGTNVYNGAEANSNSNCNFIPSAAVPHCQSGVSQRWLAFGTTGLDDLGIPTTGIEVRGLEFDGTNHGDALTKIANNYNEVLTGTSTINFSDAGLFPSIGFYWTGATGRSDPNPGPSCMNWSTSSGTGGSYAVSTASPSSASVMYQASNAFCSNTWLIICVCH